RLRDSPRGRPGLARLLGDQPRRARPGAGRGVDRLQPGTGHEPRPGGAPGPVQHPAGGGRPGPARAPDLAAPGGGRRAPRAPVATHPFRRAPAADGGAMRFGIAAKLACLLALFGVLACGLTGYYSYASSRNLILKAAERDLLTAAQVLGR